MQTSDEMEYSPKTSWQTFTPEVAWFIHDFFQYDLNNYEKLIFYSYYVNDLTFEKIADAANCTFQNIGHQVQKINKKMKYRWNNKKRWKLK